MQLHIDFDHFDAEMLAKVWLESTVKYENCANVGCDAHFEILALGQIEDHGFVVPLCLSCALELHNQSTMVQKNQVLPIVKVTK